MALFDDHDLIYRAIVVQLGDWHSIAADPKSDTAHDIDKKETRISSLRARVARVQDERLRPMYEKVLDDAAGSLADWREAQEFKARVAAIRLPDLPPE